MFLTKQKKRKGLLWHKTVSILVYRNQLSDILVLLSSIRFSLYVSQTKQLQLSGRIISLGMKNDRFASPSSKYSTKGQKLVSKGKSLLKDLTKSKAPKSPSTNKTIPLFEPTQMRFVANVPKIEGFENNNSIILTDQRVGQINRKLQIDAEAYKNYEYRTKMQKFFIDATYNPLTHQLTFQESLEKQKKVRQPLTERVNVISEIQRLRKQKVHRQALKNKMVKVENIANTIHKNFKQNKVRNPTRSVDNQSFQEISYSSREDPLRKERDVGFPWLDEIVTARQESFFQLRNRQPRNIFALLKNRNHADFQSNKEILDKVHFNFDSMIVVAKGKAKKSQINPLIQISTFAREIMVNQKKLNDMMFPSNLMFNFSALEFTDMMYLASSRLNQYNLHEHLNENMQTKNEQEQEQIALNKKHKVMDQKENTINRADNCVPATNDKTETNYYIMSHFIPIENQQVRISNKFKDKLRKLLQDEISAVNSGIFDKTTLQTFRRAMDLTLLGMLDGNAEQEVVRRHVDMDQRIRRNKVNKNRTENIKIHEVVDTVKLKKQYHKVTSRFVSPSHMKSTFY